MRHRRAIVTIGLSVSGIVAAAACQLSTDDYPSPLTGSFEAGAAMGPSSGGGEAGANGSCESLYGGVCMSDLSECANPLMGDDLCTAGQTPVDAGSTEASRHSLDATAAAADTGMMRASVSSDSGARTDLDGGDAGVPTTAVFCCRGLVEAGGGTADAFARD
jgi:hypothetical protein